MGRSSALPRSRSSATASFMPNNLAKWPACSPARCLSLPSPPPSSQRCSLADVRNFSNQLLTPLNHHETFAPDFSLLQPAHRLQKTCRSLGLNLEFSGRKKTDDRPHAQKQRQLLLCLPETGC